MMVFLHSKFNFNKRGCDNRDSCDNRAKRLSRSSPAVTRTLQPMIWAKITAGHGNQAGRHVCHDCHKDTGQKRVLIHPGMGFTTRR